jgi:hypothetical protein
MTVSRARAAALLAALAATGGIACGGGDSDEDDVKKVVDDLAKSDPAVCAKLTDRFLKQNFGGERARCEKAAEDDKTEDEIEIESTEIDGDRATVNAKVGREEGQIKFVKDDGDWKLDAVEQ